MQIKHLGEVNSGSLEWALRECAENLPGDYKRAEESWGPGAASDLRKQAAGTPMYTQMMDLLGRFFESGNKDQVQLAAFAQDPNVMPAAPLERALSRADLDAETLGEVRSALGFVLR